MFRNTLLLFSTLFLMMSANQALADRGGNNECPVGLVSGMTLDDEFGPGSGDLTQCLKKRHRVKVVIQVNQFCRDSVPNNECTRAYALGNMSNMIKDYEITHGMKPGRDYEMVAVVHSGGGGLILKNDGYDGNGNPVSGRNQFQGAVETLISQGVKFYFCQNTTRGMIRANRLPDATETTGGATAEMIDGVEYTTAGVTSIADYQSRGYSYVQP
jgi:intracellular sulfur oxidation DsrE/DsrF family protein